MPLDPGSPPEPESHNAGAHALFSDVNRVALLPLQRIGLHLSGTATIVDASAASRLHHAIAEIDHVIAGLRAVVIR